VYHGYNRRISLVPEGKKEEPFEIKYEVHFDPASLQTTVSEDKVTFLILSILKICIILD